MAKKHLLFLSHRLPYPPHNGAAIRTYNILKLLSRHYAITALCFDRDDPATRAIPLSQRLGALAPYAEIEVFPIPQETNGLRMGWDHVRSLVTGRAYTYYVHASRRFTARLRHHLARTRFDIVHVDSLDLLHFVPLIQHLPTVCTHHNVESALLDRRARAEKSWIRRTYMGHQARLLEREERQLMGLMTLNVAVSEADAAGLEKLVPGLKTAVIPNGVDVESFQPGGGETEGCVFVGGTSWFPNRDGLEWFAAEILPELDRRQWNSHVTWVGRATGEEQERYNAMPGLRLTGYVEDIRPYVQSAACFIVPLRVGGGTRLKVLDAWAMGKAVVTTRLGSEGLDARHGENVLFAETPGEFSDAIIQVLRNADLRRRLEAGARETAVRLYSWEGMGQRMAELYEEVRSSQTGAPDTPHEPPVAGPAGARPLP